MQQSFSNPTLPQSVPNLVEIQLNSFQWFLGGFAVTGCSQRRVRRVIL